MTDIDWSDEMLPNNIRIVRMGKYEGELWTEVVVEDRRYVEWLVSGEGPQMDPLLYNYLIELLEDT